MEKQAINSSPTMRLAVRMRNIYGGDTAMAIKRAKGVTKGLKGGLVERALGASKDMTDNRVDILQKSLVGASGPLGRTPGPYSYLKGITKKAEALLTKIAKEDKENAGYWAKQMATSRALRMSDKGPGILVADPELIKKRLGKSLSHAVIGGGIGAGVGAFVGGALRGPGGVRAGAALGGIPAALVGADVGTYKANRDYLKPKGVTLHALGLGSSEFTEGAKKKYIHEKYVGGGWKPKK